MQSICCILGAGYSHVAGAPLTRDLFAIRSVASPSVAAARRFETVWQDYDAWLSENLSRNPEEYLAELPKHRTVGSPVSRFSRPDALIPPFDWAVSCWEPSWQLRCPLTQWQQIPATGQASYAGSIVIRIWRFGER